MYDAEACSSAATRRDIASTNTEHGQLPEIAVIDDNAFVLDSWENGLRGVAVRSFDCASSFLDRCKSDPSFLEKLACVVTDFYLDDEGLTGLELARRVRSMNVRVPIFVATDASGIPVGEGYLDGSIGKKIPSWNELKEMISATLLTRNLAASS